MSDTSAFGWSDVHREEANYIYYYKYEIFKDLSRKEFINGAELENIYNNPSLDEKEKKFQIGRWLFFYRGWPSKLPHEKLIKDEATEIQKVIKSTQRMKINNLLQQGGVLGLTIVTGTTAFPVFMPAMVLAGGIGLFFYNYSTTQAHKKTMQRHRKRIEILKEQRNELISQITKRLKRSDMDKHWKKHKKSVRNTVLRYGSFYNRVSDEDILYQLETWGVHQPEKIFSDHVSSDTGLSDAIQAMGKSVLTWRNGRGYSNPLYRLVYYQFLIEKDAGMIIGRVFIDRVTELPFGIKAEYLRNNHISNIKIQNISIPINEQLKDLANPEIYPIIFVKEAKAISLPVSSGSIFNCVLANSKHLSKAMNSWLEMLKVDKKHQNLLNASKDENSSWDDLHDTATDLDNLRKKQQDELDRIVHSLYNKLELQQV